MDEVHVHCVKYPSMIASRLPSVLALCVLVVAAGCKKDDPLPEAKWDGPDVFACKINGKNFVAKSSGSLFVRSPGVDGGFTWDIYPYKRRNQFYLTGDDGQISVDLFVDFFDTLGVYPLIDSIRCPFPACSPHSNYALYNSSHITTPKNNGQIRFIKADTTLNKSLGTFSFKGKAKDGSTVDVSDGRFYYQYRP